MTSPAQRIGFCTTRDGVRIAYAVSGSGPPLIKTAHWMSHVEADWDSPVWHPWLSFLSRHRTLIRFDPRGCGLSEQDVGEVSLEAWSTDLEAVVEATGAERFDLLGMSQGGPVGVAFAAAQPRRVTRLILYGAYARGRARRALPKGEKAMSEALLQLIRSGWGRPNPAFRQLFTSLFLPGGSDEQVQWFNELQRISTTPEMAARIAAACDDLDVADAARGVTVPTLVLHARGDARVPVGEGRLLASLIPTARLVELASDNHVLLASEPAWAHFMEQVGAFLDVREPPAPVEPPPVAAIAALTPRELDVLASLAEGLTNKQIARRLELSPKTVRNYVSLVLAKLGVATRTEAATKALRTGMFAGGTGAAFSARRRGGDDDQARS